MSSCYITVSDHIISSILLSLLLISSPLYSIQFCSIQLDFNLIWFISIPLDSIEFIILYSIVSYLNEWFVSICQSVCLSVCLSVWLSVCLSVWISFSSLFFSYLFSYFVFLISFSSVFPDFYFFMNIFLAHSHTCTWTLTRTLIHMNICSFWWPYRITTKACKWRIVFERLYYLLFDFII